MKEYKVVAYFTFRCNVDVMAETPEDARRITHTNMWMVANNVGNSGDERITDWEFSPHPIM